MLEDTALVRGIRRSAYMRNIPYGNGCFKLPTDGIGAISRYQSTRPSEQGHPAM